MPQLARGRGPLPDRPERSTGPTTASISSTVTPPARSRTGRRAGEIEHGRFEPDRAGAAVEDKRDRIAQLRCAPPPRRSG